MAIFVKSYRLEGISVLDWNRYSKLSITQVVKLKLGDDHLHALALTGLLLKPRLNKVTTRHDITSEIAISILVTFFHVPCH
jgi:hypothetical protein